MLSVYYYLSLLFSVFFRHEALTVECSSAYHNIRGYAVDICSLVSLVIGGHLSISHSMVLKARFWGFVNRSEIFSLKQLCVAKLEHKLYLIT